MHSPNHNKQGCYISRVICVVQVTIVLKYCGYMYAILQCNAHLVALWQTFIK